jgi:hypothetical protein
VPYRDCFSNLLNFIIKMTIWVVGEVFRSKNWKGSMQMEIGIQNRTMAKGEKKVEESSRVVYIHPWLKNIHLLFFM